MIEIPKKVKERVFLIGLKNLDEDKADLLESMDELAELAKTAEAEVVETFIQALKKPNATYFIGQGKLKEIKAQIESNKVTTLIFNDNLSPAQARNIAKTTHCNIVDRTELILDIFSKHAKTKEAKLQVELAQLQYSYSKLRNLWQHFSRIEGGIGLRGPGERQIEVDRRAIRKKITILKERLEEIKRDTETKRKNRRQFTTVALMGYTNAGKSTIFNRLTNEQQYAADQLFATLDSTTRRLNLSRGQNVLITDTIGFIRKLPHSLISSFHSTLLDVMEADLLLQVVDIAHPRLDELIKSVEDVLVELKADHKDIIIVFNKTDKLAKLHHRFLQRRLEKRYPDSVFISALEDQDMSNLKGIIEYFLFKKKIQVTFHVPEEMEDLLDYIRNRGEVLEQEYIPEEKETRVSVMMLRKIIPQIRKQIEDHRLLEQIHK